MNNQPGLEVITSGRRIAAFHLKDLALKINISYSLSGVVVVKYIISYRINTNI